MESDKSWQGTVQAIQSSTARLYTKQTKQVRDMKDGVQASIAVLIKEMQQSRASDDKKVGVCSKLPCAILVGPTTHRLFLPPPPAAVANAPLN